MPFSRRLFAASLITLFAYLPDASHAHTPAEPAQHTSPLPADFKIVAQYGSGESNWAPWTTTITREGRAAQTVYDKNPRITRLTPEQMRRLLTQVEQAKFFTLQKHYPAPAKDIPVLILTVTVNHRVHTVMVDLDTPPSGNRDVKRFLKVWAQVLREVPSPNPQQTPES